ncbi:phytoene desaturase family protein [Flavobacterium difficile]|uniref:Phytoene desaturase n=1 Tax=Flavobacterium difficile TaxID=2709659 RepID=A0ABX0I3L2_9FLAO|nr:oleate hydratase [Flavobacterium difficile]NHM01316.1 phytoene desaturase [Flavobacterium difficile]
MPKTIQIIGSGFSSLAAACYLAKEGNKVTVYEKNPTLGGRARQFSEKGFTFDMGPSWYWMPDVFESFFADFQKKPSDYYSLEKLSPGYRVFFENNEHFDVSDDLNTIIADFEKIETGSGKQLEKFISTAKNNYEIAIKNLVYRPGETIFELITPQTALKIDQFFSNIKKDVRKKIKNKNLQQILEFPVLFLGAKPSDTPSFYNFMNYADFGLGTWQPKNGFFDVIQAMVNLGTELGVTYHTNSSIDEIVVEANKATGIKINNTFLKSDVVLSGADYHHTETLLPKSNRQYSEEYWNKKTFAPSSLLFYVGFDKKLENVCHHNLFFDTDFEKHALDIYDNPKWPDEPLFYANFTSITNEQTAPKGCENGFFLVPIAPNLEDTEELRELYFNKILKRFEEVTKQDVRKNIIFKKSFCVNDFKSEYNSYKGNAYGMANTLLQTAVLRPKLKSKKVKNLYFTGQLTVPGPGVPPALISGKLVSQLIQKYQ